MPRTYGEAVEEVLAMIVSKQRLLYNYSGSQLGAEHLTQHAKTAAMFQKLGDKQKGFDILVVPAHFSHHHKGRSVRRAREVFPDNEFGLGAFAIGIMLLTHPERGVDERYLHVICAGDEFSNGIYARSVKKYFYNLPKPQKFKNTNEKLKSNWR
ncbi:MAG: hypothetical protein IPL87_03255 [Candidatus Moraniibacteriota bacterium]|nr:MAG: hypothetical protein IPL87_03255 [Candidatus Moranbacteria bacterium]